MTPQTRPQEGSHTHDPQAVAKVAAAIAIAIREEVLSGNRTPQDEFMRVMAVAALDAVEALYETEAGDE